MSKGWYVPDNTSFVDTMAEIVDRVGDATTDLTEYFDVMYRMSPDEIHGIVDYYSQSLGEDIEDEDFRRQGVFLAGLIFGAELNRKRGRQ